MNMTVRHLRSCYCSIASFHNTLALGTLLCAFVILPAAGAAQAQEQPQERTAEQQFKNIKVFQGLPASQLIPAMSYMRAALGVQCSYCHVERDFDKDDKEEKESARKMIAMVRNINGANFGGRSEVTCNTCHHGKPHPEPLPAFSEITGKPATPPSAAARITPAPAVSADQVFDRYLQAVGGRSALEKVQTIVMRGTRATSEGWSAPIEIYQKAPNKMSTTFKLNSAITTVFDGTIGWSQTDRGILEIAGPGLQRLKQEAQISRSLNLRDEYQSLRVLGKQAVGDREAYVVQGTTKSDRRPERLFFEVESGLLLRISSREMTPLGPLPEQTDFDDYRDVDGVKLPFAVSHLGADRSYKDVYSEISQNVPIDDGKFEKPAGGSSPSGAH